MTKKYRVMAKNNFEVHPHSWKKGLDYEVVENDDYFVLATDLGSINYYNTVKDEVLENFVVLKNNFNVKNNVTVWAFENKQDSGRYLCDGIDCVDDDHENGDVTDLSQALVVFAKELAEPTNKHLEEFKEFMKSLTFSIDWDNDVEPNYNAVKVELTPLQVAIIRDRNEW